MKTILSAIFLILFLLPNASFAQVKIYGSQDVIIEPQNRTTAFVRKELVITKSVQEKAPPIVISNKIPNAKVYGNDKSVQVDLEANNKVDKTPSKQIVIDLAEAKAEMDLAEVQASKFSQSTIDNPNLASFVFFDVNSTKLRPEYFLELKKLNDLLIAKPDMNIEIIGHADTKGSEYGNDVLAESRAKIIYEFLTGALQMDPKRFTTSSANENFFKVPAKSVIDANNQSEKNRSVSFILREKNIINVKEELTIDDAPAKPVVKSTKNGDYADGQVIGFIFFDEGKSRVKQEYYSELFKLNTVIESMPGTQIVLVGHGDIMSSEMSKPLISKERSESIYTFLTSIFKMDPSRLEMYHEGENNFKVPEGNTVNATNKNEMNRSVTVILKQK